MTLLVSLMDEHLPQNLCRRLFVSFHKFLTEPCSLWLFAGPGNICSKLSHADYSPRFTLSTRLVSMFQLFPEFCNFVSVDFISK